MKSTSKTTNAPKLRFPEFTDDWEIRKLGEISEKVKEKNKNREFIETLTNSAELGVISQRDFFDKEISNIDNITNYYIVQHNDFIYNPRISNLAPVGPIKRNKLGRTGVMSPLYYVFRLNSDVEPSYLEIYFETKIWHKFMYLNGDTGARSDRFAIKDNIFVQMPIMLPSIKEQTTIGNFFRQVDKLIALHQGKLDNIKTLKKGLLQKMFPAQGETVPQIRFPQFTDAWEQRKLGKVVEKVKSYSLSRNVEVAEFTGFKYIHYGDIHRGIANIIHSDEILPNIQAGNFELLKQGDLVLADASEDYEGVGASCVIDCFSKNNLVAGLHTIAIRPIKTDHLFLYYLLNTQTFKQYGRFVGTGTKVVAISPTNLLKFKTNIPTNPTEQTTIGNFFRQFDDLISLHQRKLEHLKMLKKSLLQQMFV